MSKTFFTSIDVHPDDMALNSFSRLCSNNVSSVWTVQYSMAFLCLQLHHGVHRILRISNECIQYSRQLNSNIHPPYEQGAFNQPLHGK